HTFESGQLYVALSRSVRSENLTIYPKIEARYLHAQKAVQEFYDSLTEGGNAGHRQVSLDVAATLPPAVLQYMAETGCDVATALMHFVQLGISQQ
ncbi:MAG: hypothetical protein IKG69_07150, partial [Atopobiaceae bacterium]|nr:hypothetical protein [Atopobiaceae bacterium]